MLHVVKKCIFSFSRKESAITFTDIVTFLQTYYLYENPSDMEKYVFIKLFTPI